MEKSKKMNLYLPQINGVGVTLTSVYKYQFHTWKLKEELILSPEQVGQIFIKDIVKVKLYKHQPVNQHYVLKIIQKKPQYDQLQHEYAIAKENLQFFFYKLITFRLQLLDLQFVKKQQFMNICEASCYKKSELLKKWEPRYVIITYTDGLMSGKAKQLQPTLEIKHTKQVWTRFEIIQIQNMKLIVIKLKYGIIKQEFGVPADHAIKWFKAFYSLFLNE